MSNVSVTDRYWGPMLQGKPVHSWYFWKAVLFSLFAVGGMAKLLFKVHSNTELTELLVPALAVLLTVMVYAGSRAIRMTGIVARQVENTELVNTLAFEFFRMYLIVTAIAGAAVWLLIAVA